MRGQWSSWPIYPPLHYPTILTCCARILTWPSFCAITPSVAGPQPVALPGAASGPLLTGQGTQGARGDGREVALFALRAGRDRGSRSTAGINWPGDTKRLWPAG
jgi:hypothetical protein